MKIGGKERRLKFGMNQTILYCDLRGVSITKMNEELGKLSQDSGGILRDLVWSALKDGARVTGDKFDYTNYDVGDWLEDLTEEGVNAFLEAMTETLPKGDKETKKKVPTPEKK